MTRSDARSLLDDVRDGMDASEVLITDALRATGDLPPTHAPQNEPDDAPPVRVWRPVGRWEMSLCASTSRMIVPATPFDGLLL